MKKRGNGFNFLRLLIAVIKFLVPVTVIVLKLLNPHVPNGWFFVAFILLLVIERSYETFYSKKIKKNLTKLDKDRCFIAVTLAYTAMVFIMMFEFFLVPRNIDLSIALFGGVIFFIALALRLWGVNTLGDSWQVKDPTKSLVTNKGPYKYMRHPIYFGFILEVLVVSLIPGTNFALLYAIVLFVPLILLKTYLEERDLLGAYKSGYQNYINEKYAFIVFCKFQRKKMVKENL